MAKNPSFFWPTVEFRMSQENDLVVQFFNFFHRSFFSSKFPALLNYVLSNFIWLNLKENRNPNILSSGIKMVSFWGKHMKQSYFSEFFHDFQVERIQIGLYIKF